MEKHLNLFVGENQVFSLRGEWLRGECDWIKNFVGIYLKNGIIKKQQKRFGEWKIKYFLKKTAFI